MPHLPLLLFFPAAVPLMFPCRLCLAEFFAQNRLPETHCGYRVAPGVCHITPEEGRYLPNDTTSF